MGDYRYARLGAGKKTHRCNAGFTVTLCGLSVVGRRWRLRDQEPPFGQRCARCWR
jgi:hypothetical protein